MILQAVLDAAVIILGLAIFVVVALAVRRRLLQRGGGTFDCSLRLGQTAAGQGWVLGIARYSGDAVEWFRVFSFSMRPRRVFTRTEVEIRSSRDPLSTEALGMYDGHVVVELTEAGHTVEIAMAEDALTGFMAWLESAPPGKSRTPL